MSYEKTIATMSILALMLAIIPSIYTDTSYAWYSSSWLYRMPIIINNTANPDNLTDYQIKINITYDSNMSQNFSDIRFTWYNQSNSTEVKIPYWIENKVNSSYAIVWIKVPHISANDKETVYLYYGNSSVSSESNVSDVFIRIINGTIGSWHLNGNADDIYGNYDGTWSGNEQYGNGVYSQSAEFDASSYINCGIVNTNKDILTISFWMNWTSGYKEAVVYFGSYGLYIWSDCFGFNTWNNDCYGVSLPPDLQGNWKHIVAEFHEGDYTINKLWIDGNPQSLSQLRNSPNTGNLHIKNVNFIMAKAQPASNQMFNGYIDHVCIFNHTISDDAASDLYNYYAYHTNNHTGVTYLKKHTSVEPTYSFGSEEILNTNNPPEIFVYNPTNSTIYYDNNISINITIQDNDSANFTYNIYDDNILIRSGNATNSTNITLFITKSDGNHTLIVNCTDSNSSTNSTTIFYTVETIPEYSNPSASPSSPQYYGISNINLTVKWSDKNNNIAQVLVIHNFMNSSLSNYSMKKSSDDRYYYVVESTPTVGTYVYRFVCIDTNNNTNSTPWYQYVINQGTGAEITTIGSQSYCGNSIGEIVVLVQNNGEPVSSSTKVKITLWNGTKSYMKYIGNGMFSYTFTTPEYNYNGNNTYVCYIQSANPSANGIAGFTVINCPSTIQQQPSEGTNYAIIVSGVIISAVATFLILRAVDMKKHWWRYYKP